MDGTPRRSTIPETSSQPDPTSQSETKGEYEVGDVLMNHYEIVRVIRGGMGTVYKVLDTEHGWFLAAKTTTYFEEKYAKQFEVEIQHLIELPLFVHVVQVGSIKLIGNRPFVFMEYIEGTSLHEKLSQLDQHKLDFGIAINYAVQLCRGLHFLHDKGHLLHLDVKPENILIDQQSIVKISDFGISQPSLILARKLIPPTGAGTVEYMSPEQLKGEQVDVWSDIYSFGLVFYEMLKGRLPYPFDVSSARSSNTLREKLLAFHDSKNDFHEQLSHQEIIAGQSNEVGTIIGHCLAKMPEKRVVDFRYLERWIEREFGQFINKPSIRLQGVDFYRKAINLQAIGKHSKALEWFNHALSVDQSNPRLWEDTAKSCAELGMKEEETLFLNRANQLVGG